jgi:DNA processing protein
MRTAEPMLEAATACARCLRRSWLLSTLSPALDYRCRDRPRLSELLSLADEELIEAVGGRRRAELRARHSRFRPADLQQAEGAESVCRHHRSYPSALSDRGGPAMLSVTSGVRRLAELTAAPIVAIVGSTQATDYGMEMAKSLARGLAASGVTVAAALTDGIAVAAHAGALELDGGIVAVLPGGLEVACPAKRRSLYERIKRSGCAVAELPGDCEPRRWGHAAGERILARLAGLTIVVEAHDSPGELAGARIAQACGRTVAAVPGRVTSPVSSGTHALLLGGAHLVRGPADALELICGSDTPAAPAPANAREQLGPRLRSTLERVGAGDDTPERLAGHGVDAGELLLELSELELMGLLTRGDGGRYVPRDAICG